MKKTIRIKSTSHNHSLWVDGSGESVNRARQIKRYNRTIWLAQITVAHTATVIVPADHGAEWIQAGL